MLPQRNTPYGHSAIVGRSRTCYPLRPSSSEQPLPKKVTSHDLPERLETERLLLRWPTEADAAEIFARYASDPVVTKYLTWAPHKSVDDTLEFLESETNRRAPSSTGSFILRDGGQLLGSIGCQVDKHIVQFGYCYARDAWGRGYATEAARAMVPVWLSDPAVWRVQAFCDPRISRRLACWRRPG